MGADGSNPHAITSGAPYYGVAWSPDGASIATLDWPSRTVYTLDAADARRCRCRDLRGSDSLAVHPGGIQYVPGWQPRGTGEGDDGG
jgi:hypothetical protein